jgi:hypothetical protein
MSGFGIVRLDDGYQVVLSAFDAMYVRAKQNNDERLIMILEHRSKDHAGGPCTCEIMPGDNH